MKSLRIALGIALVALTLLLAGCGDYAFIFNKNHQEVVAELEKELSLTVEQRELARKAQTKLQEEIDLLKKNLPTQVASVMTIEACSAVIKTAVVESCQAKTDVKPLIAATKKVATATVATATSSLGSAHAGAHASAGKDKSALVVQCIWVHPAVNVDFSAAQVDLAGKHFHKPASHTGSCPSFVNEMAEKYNFPAVRKIG